MKLRFVAPLAIAASAAAIGLAPIAAAQATVQQSPGNAEITATPGAAAQQAGQNQQPSAGIWAPCYTTTSGAGAGPEDTDHDRALRAGQLSVPP